MNIVLWIIQVLLALLFLFAGGTKLVLPIQVLESMGSPNAIHLPGLLMRVIGVCEVLGGLGLILPGLLKIKPGLTALAAAGLVIVMIGAVVLTVAGDGIGAAVVPFVVLLLLIFVAYGRWRLAPLVARLRHKIAGAALRGRPLHSANVTRGRPRRDAPTRGFLCVAILRRFITLHRRRRMTRFTLRLCSSCGNLAASPSRPKPTKPRFNGQWTR
jgi:uncharacterized membrane protein YphA (DoxX/SURF4 family)